MSELRVNHRIYQRGRALARGRWRRVKVAAASGNFGGVLLVSGSCGESRHSRGKS